MVVIILEWGPNYVLLQCSLDLKVKYLYVDDQNGANAVLSYYEVKGGLGT